MKKIDKLTPEQEALVPVYLKKWLDIGYSTEPLNKEKTAESVAWLYKFGGKPAPYMWFCDSPMQIQLLINLFKNEEFKKLLGVNLGSNLGSNLWSNLESNLWSNLWSNLRSNLESNLEFNYFFAPNLETGWIGFYDFILNELFPEKKGYFHIFQKECQDFYKNTYMIIPFENICFISERPTSIVRNQFSRLHCEYGPAITFKDGYELNVLNGVNLPNWTFSGIPMDEKLTKTLSETNTEVRMTLMRHFGLDNFLDVLKAEKLDSKENYELYTVEIEGNRCGPYLKMKCPSTGRIYFEGVGDPDKYEFLDMSIKTCDDALADRFQKASNSLLKNLKGCNIDLSQLTYRA